MRCCGCLEVDKLTNDIPAFMYRLIGLSQILDMHIWKLSHVYCITLVNLQAALISKRAHVTDHIRENGSHNELY